MSMKKNNIYYSNNTQSNDTFDIESYNTNNVQSSDIFSMSSYNTNNIFTLSNDTCNTQSNDTCYTQSTDTCNTKINDTCNTQSNNTCNTLINDTCNTYSIDTCNTQINDTCNTQSIDTCNTQINDSCNTQSIDTCNTQINDSCNTQSNNIFNTQSNNTNTSNMNNPFSHNITSYEIYDSDEVFTNDSYKCNVSCIFSDNDETNDETNDEINDEINGEDNNEAINDSCNIFINSDTYDSDCENNKYNSYEDTCILSHISQINNGIENSVNNENNTCLNIIDIINDKMDKNNDLLQQQLNLYNCSYTELLNEIKQDNYKYSQLIHNIDNINDIINSLQINNNIHTNDCKFGRKIYNDFTVKHTFIVKHDIQFIYITMVAGGGAGGIGYYENMYYYSGGGGGSGACLIKKPINVIENTIINITVGKGSDVRYDFCGGDTIIELIYPCLKTEIIKVNGGQNSNTLETYKNKIIKGGKGGDGYNKCFSGNNGEDGIISVPSFVSANGGNGGGSVFCNGGTGGGNYVSLGGEGGNIHNLIGSNGKFGSGGGGSCPRILIDKNNQLSGNGGNGFVIIEW
jgi:hypothetical protein